MPETQTINQEAGLPDNWVPMDAAPLNPGTQRPAINQNTYDPYTSGSLPVQLGLQTDLAKLTYTQDTRVPSVRLMPVAANAIINSAVQSIVRSSTVFGGGVTSVSAEPPLSVSNPTTTPDISFTGILSILHGGTGTATPSLIAGNDITITGLWPNQRISFSGSVSVVEIPLAPSVPGNFTVAHGITAPIAFVLVSMDSTGSIWLQTPSFDGTNIYATASDGGITGVAACFLTVADAQVNLAPVAPGNFTVAHGLSGTPALSLIQMTSGGAIWFQNPTPWDATNLYLTASDGAITGIAEVWNKVPTVTVSTYEKISLAPGAAGNFTVAHGLGQTPILVLIRMTSTGDIWLQSPSYDATNLYLTASDGGITADAEVWAS